MNQIKGIAIFHRLRDLEKTALCEICVNLKELTRIPPFGNLIEGKVKNRFSGNRVSGIRSSGTPSYLSLDNVLNPQQFECL